MAAISSSSHLIIYAICFVLGFFPAREVLLVQTFCVSSFSERQHPADNAAFAKMTYKHVHPPA